MLKVRHVNKRAEKAQKSPKIGKKLSFNCLNGGYTPPFLRATEWQISFPDIFFLFFFSHTYKYIKI